MRLSVHLLKFPSVRRDQVRCLPDFQVCIPAADWRSLLHRRFYTRLACTRIKPSWTDFGTVHEGLRRQGALCQVTRICATIGHQQDDSRYSNTPDADSMMVHKRSIGMLPAAPPMKSTLESIVQNF